MKMRPEHYAIILDAFRPYVGVIPEARENRKRDPTVRDVEMRLRWDILRAAGLIHWVCTDLYPYLNDAHIDSALRKVMSDLGVSVDSGGK